MIEETFPFHLSSIGGCLTNMSICFGAFISMFLGLVLPDDGKDKDLAETEMWRVIFGFPIFFSFIVIIMFGCVFTHDSPKYYLAIGDEEGARNAIRKFYDTEFESEDDVYNFMKRSVVSDTSTTTLKQALTDKKYKMGTFVALVIIFFHEIVGINVVLAYSHFILERADPNKTSVITPKIGTILIGTINFLACVVSVYLVKNYGRVKLLFWGHFWIFVFHFLAATCFLLNYNIMMLFFMNLFLIAYEFSTGTVCWIYIAEVVVDSALGLCVLTLFSTVFFLNLIVEFLIDDKNFGLGGVFYMMGLMSLGSSAFVKKYMKETRGLTDKEKKQLYFPTDSLGGNKLETESNLNKI